jgi:hypothetical protein
MAELRSPQERISVILLVMMVLMLIFVLFASPSYTDTSEVSLITLTPFSWVPHVVSGPTPTITFTPTVTASDIRITDVVYEPPSGFDILHERVVFHNYGGPQNMTGWTLEDNDGNVYSFPSGFIFGRDADVNVWVKGGTNTQTDLYWGRYTPVWNEHDTATLRDNAGQIVDQWSW